MSRLRIAIALAVLFAAIGAGCASQPTRAQCQQDSYQAGLNAGRTGLGPGAFQKRVAACQSIGVQVAGDKQRFQAGREAGLKDYCTFAGGVRAGRSGRPVRHNCPEDQAPDFNRGFDLGRRIHYYEQRINDLRSEAFDLRQQLDQRVRKRSYNVYIAQRLNDLQMEQMRLEQRLQELKQQAEREGAGPLPPSRHPFNYP